VGGTPGSAVGAGGAVGPLPEAAPPPPAEAASPPPDGSAPDWAEGCGLEASSSAAASGEGGGGSGGDEDGGGGGGGGGAEDADSFDDLTKRFAALKRRD